MSLEKTRGLILKEIKIKENDKIVTILTPGGKVRALARGCRKQKSRLRSGVQPFCYSDMVFYHGRGDLSIIDECEVLESFYDMRFDLDKLALCTYFADIVCICLEGDEAERVLRLCLNTFYILQKNGDLTRIKAAFEWRLAMLLGFGAELGACVRCGATEGLCGFSPGEGGAVCTECISHFSGDFEVSSGAFEALRYISYCGDNKVFSFEVSDAVLEEICRVAEEYLLFHMEKIPESLIYYKKLGKGI